MDCRFAGDNVVPLAGGRSNMRFSVVAEVAAYWEALRAGRVVPLRSDVDPRGIEQALENAFILERIAPQVARFRLCGSHLNDLMGMEARGMPLTTFFVPSARARVADLIENVFSGPHAVELDLTAETGLCRSPLAARMLIPP